MNCTRDKFLVSKQGAYLMNAAIGGVHIDTANEIGSWTSNTSRSGAINDFRYFELLEEARSTAAEFLSVHKDEVAFSGSTSLNMNLFALMLKTKGITKIVAPSVEFPSSTVPWFHHGFEVDLVEPREGRVFEEDLISRARSKNTAVVCSAVQFLTGQRFNLEFLGEELSRLSTPFIINGTQQVGQFPLSLSKIKFTAYTASLHKWLGADLGLSLIVMPSSIKESYKMPIAGWTSVEDPWRLANEAPRFVSDMSAFQTGTMPFNLLAGAKMAMQVQLDYGQKNIASEVLSLSDKLSSVITSQGFKLISPRVNEFDRTGICTFEYDGNLEKALELLAKKKVFVNGRRGSIRASIHYFNNESDLELFSKALGSI